MKVMLTIRKIINVLWALYIVTCIMTGTDLDIYQMGLLAVYVLLTGVQDYQVPNERKDTLSD